MKEKKTKNHKENWIGNIIRGFLLFMPLLAIITTCAYAIFNKNAKDSYSDKDIYQQFVIQNSSQWVNDVVLNATYKAPLDTSNSNFGLTGLSYISYTKEELNLTQAQYDTITQIYFVRDGRMQFRDASNTTLATKYWRKDTTFNFITSDSAPVRFFDVAVITETTYVQNELDNVFYYSINKVQQSPLFNWSTNTSMYNVIHGACNTLGIESTFVPFLLAYWLLTYLIYIIYDIALLIVNMAHNRIHDVESSI